MKRHSSYFYSNLIRWHQTAGEFLSRLSKTLLAAFQWWPCAGWFWWSWLPVWQFPPQKRRLGALQMFLEWLSQHLKCGGRRTPTRLPRLPPLPAAGPEESPRGLSEGSLEGQENEQRRGVEGQKKRMGGRRNLSLIQQRQIGRDMLVICNKQTNKILLAQRNATILQTANSTFK